MPLSQLETDIGRLGTELAQKHYATTSDLDGVLPWLPTDADRAELVRMLGRAATRHEESIFESGYRESMMRLDGNAHDVRINAVMRHELYGALTKYGFTLPAEGTPERMQAELMLTRGLAVIRDQIAQLLPAGPPPREEPAEVAPPPP